MFNIVIFVVSLLTAFGLGALLLSVRSFIVDLKEGEVDWLDAAVKLLSFTALTGLGVSMLYRILIREKMPSAWSMIAMAVVLVVVLIYHHVRIKILDGDLCPDVVKRDVDQADWSDDEEKEVNLWMKAQSELRRWFTTTAIAAIIFLVLPGMSIYAQVTSTGNSKASASNNASSNSVSKDATSKNQVKTDSLSGNKKSAKKTSTWGGDVDPLLAEKFGKATEKDEEVLKKWQKYFAKSGVSSDPFKENDEARLKQSKYDKPARFGYTKAKSRKQTVKEFRQALARDPIYSGGMAAAVNTHFNDIVKKYPRVREFAELYNVVYNTPDADYYIGNTYWTDGTGQNLNQVTKYYMAWTIELYAKEYKYHGVESRSIRQQWGLPTKFETASDIPGVVRDQFKVGDTIPNDLRHLKLYSDKDKLPSVIWVHRKGKTEDFGTLTDGQNFRLFVKAQSKTTTPAPTKATPKGSTPTGQNPGTPNNPATPGNPGGQEQPSGGNEPAPEGNPGSQEVPGYVPSTPQEEPKNPGGSINNTSGGAETGNRNNPGTGPQETTPNTSGGTIIDDGSGGGESQPPSDPVVVPPQDTNGGYTDQTEPAQDAPSGDTVDHVIGTQTDTDGNTTTQTSDPATETLGNRKEIAD